MALHEKSANSESTGRKKAQTVIALQEKNANNESPVRKKRKQ